ncbi:hypothetical protein HMPREF1980_00322 [Actinomyces sp. oral taxon 172 str. F0311]|nr:hypothetical protein HMPREF1980_00322 [Actinomyces sp. oral taxon 172 str. F0311]
MSECFPSIVSHVRHRARNARPMRRQTAQVACTGATTTPQVPGPREDNARTRKTGSTNAAQPRPRR